MVSTDEKRKRFEVQKVAECYFLSLAELRRSLPALWNSAVGRPHKGARLAHPHKNNHRAEERYSCGFQKAQQKAVRYASPLPAQSTAKSDRAG